MRHLVEKYGGKRVWQAGLKVLKFPPTWVQETASAVAVAEELERS